jgi:LPS-assembly protein
MKVRHKHSDKTLGIMRPKQRKIFGVNSLPARLALAASIGLALVAVLPSVSADAALGSGKVKPQLKTPPKGTRLHVTTDRLSYDARTQIATATGRTIITYGKYVLIATKVIYDRRHDRMKAIGSVHLREPGGNILQADVAQLQNRFRDGFAKHLRLLLTNDATLTADYARRRDGTITVYQHVTYTRCKDCLLADGTPLWQIKSGQVTHNEDEGVIYHKDVTFQFLGADVLWLPELSHPDPTVKRRTGFLIPTFNYSSTYGLGVGIPYFINLAPNYDLTLRPVLTTRQGPMARATWRHRLAKGKYSIDAAGIYQLDKNVPAPGNRRWRGFVRSKGDFRINKRWGWGWDGTLVSDDTFGRRYDVDKRIDIINRTYLTGLNDRNYFSLEALNFRGLLLNDKNSTYANALPFLRYNLMMDRPVLGGELGFNTTMYKLHRTKSLSINPATINQGNDQTRAIFEAHWKRRIVSDLGAVITPFARLRADIYATNNLPNSPSGDHVTGRILPTAGVDLRLPFVRSDETSQQILTPVLQLITAANETDTNKIGNEDAVSLNLDYSSLFLHNRFTGSDRFEGGTRANIGLMYSWLFNNGGFLRVSAGQSYHFAGRNSFARGSGLHGDYSDIVMALAFQPNENLQFSYQARLDDRNFKIKTQEVGLKGNYGNLSGSVNYVDIAAAPAFGRPLRQQQVWGDAEYMVSARWSVFGSARYDLRLNREYRHTVGIAYNCDCFGFKLFYKQSNSKDRDATTKRSIFMSLEFKTLGSATVGSGF